MCANLGSPTRRLSHSHAYAAHTVRLRVGTDKDDFWWFEPMQQLRKLFLTGYVMAAFPDDTVTNVRLTAATVVTLTFLAFAIYENPYRDFIGGQLYAMQQILLLVLFNAGILIRLCEDQEVCRTFGFGSAFHVSLFCAAWSISMCGSNPGLTE